MATYSYSNLKSDVNGLIGNQNVSAVGLRRNINNAILTLFEDIDFKSTIRHTQGVNVLYDNIFRYTLPSDVKGDAIIDIQKTSDKLQASNTEYTNVPIEEFNRNFYTNTYALDYDNNQKWLMGKFVTDSNQIILHKMNSLTENGTWTATDNGTNIAINEVNMITGAASISCDLAALGTTLSIVNSTASQVDISDLDDDGSLFVWVYFPSVENVTGVTLDWGNDVSNYESVTSTTPFYFSAFQVGWNLVEFPYANATETGTVDETVIDYLKVSISFSSTPSTLTGYLFDNIVAGLGDAVEVIYYSQFPWKNSSGVWIEESSADTDTLNMTTEEYQVLKYFCALEVGMTIPISTERINLLSNRFETVRANYLRRYPSQRVELISQLYDINA